MNIQNTRVIALQGEMLLSDSQLVGLKALANALTSPPLFAPLHVFPTSTSTEKGYDLVTGWGSPNGIALINALAP
jgi:hypothetical protein